MSAGRYIVTGGAGFIGRHVTAGLLAQGAAVVVVDDGSAGLPADIPGSQPLRGDIRDPSVMQAAFDLLPGADVIHLAALHHIPTCIAEPRRALDINVTGTQTVLDAARHAGTKRVVLASTGAVYGWNDQAVTEEAPTGPTDVYGISKLTNEQQGAVWAAETGACVRIARIFNAIGAGDPHGHLIPDILKRLLGGSVSSLPLGALTPRRDYLHVSDIAAGLIALVKEPSDLPVDTFNLASGAATSVEELALRLMRLVGRTVPLESRDDLRRRRDRPVLWGDPGKAARLLGWQVQFSLDDALRDVIAAAPLTAEAVL